MILANELGELSTHYILNELHCIGEGYLFIHEEAENCAKVMAQWIENDCN